MLEVGDCFLIETNHDADGFIQSHLHIIVLEKEEFTGNTIIVVIETLRSGRTDKTTILRPGDHEFIKKESYVNYRRSRQISTRTIEKLLQDKKAKSRASIKSDILKKIQEGILKSPFTPAEVVSMYENHLYRKLKK